MVLGFGKWAAKKFLKEGPKAIKSVPANVGSLKETGKFKESLEKILDKRAKNVKETKTLLKAAGATATAGAGAAGVSLYNKKKKKD